MEELEPAQIEELEALLKANRQEIEDRLRATLEGAKPVDLDEPIGRLSRVDAIQAQQITRAQRGRDEASLKMIKAALARIARGDYGLCARCDEPIGLPRLRARPESAMCVGCRSAAE